MNKENRTVLTTEEMDRVKSEICANLAEFTSPVYKVARIPVWDIVGQSVNPNSLTSSAFSALTQSIFNQGYAMSITCQENPTYDKSSDTLPILEKIKLVIEGSESDSKSAGGEYATQVSDENIRKMFPIQIVDGQQRSSVVRVGTKLFIEDPNREEKAAKWSRGEDIPDKPGNEMLKYVAWREKFSLPCAILVGKSDSELMSATILMNVARGSHSLDSMRDIVNNLINVAGRSKEWVAQNLFLDIEAIDRMQQLSGLKASMTDIDDCDLAWNVKSDDSYKRKMDAYLSREAAKFVEVYKEANPDKEIESSGSIVDIAVSLGWNVEDAKRANRKANRAFFAPKEV